MKKTVITYRNKWQSKQERRNNLKINMQRKYGKPLICGKCGKKLELGDIAYRTTRKYLCEECGKNAEIEAL